MYSSKWLLRCANRRVCIPSTPVLRATTATRKYKTICHFFKRQVGHEDVQDYVLPACVSVLSRSTALMHLLMKLSVIMLTLWQNYMLSTTSAWIQCQRKADRLSVI